MRKYLFFCAFLAMMSTAAYCDEADQGAPQQQQGENVLSSGPEMHSEIAGVQQKIVGDPAMMQIVAKLMFDPEFQELMKDPEIVAAVQAQDVQALMHNQKFLNLMNNPEIRELNDKVRESPQ